MGISIFNDPNVEPDIDMVQDKLKDTFSVYQMIITFVETQYPNVSQGWNYYKKFGWNLRVKSKKRTVFGLRPWQGKFLIGFTYGQKATDAALSSDLSETVKSIIKEGIVCSMGRTFHIEVPKSADAESIQTLIQIKMKH